MTLSKNTFIHDAGALVILLGVAVLSGWSFDIPVLKSVFPGLPTLKPVTAISFVLAGFSLYLIPASLVSKKALLISRIAASLVMLSGLIELCQYLFNFDLGIDALFFPVPPPGASFSDLHPGRINPGGAFLLTTLGYATLLCSDKRAMNKAQNIAIVSSVIPIVTLLSYMFGATSIFAYRLMGVHAAFGYLVLSMGILVATSEFGLIARFKQNLSRIFISLAMALLMLAVLAMAIDTQQVSESYLALVQTHGADQTLITEVLAKNNSTYISLGFSIFTGLALLWFVFSRLRQEVTDRERAEKEATHMAYHDLLTKLPNRRLFQDRLDQEIKKSQRDKHIAALLLIDLDHFKNVNDTLGHDMGDALLIEAAGRIKSCVRGYDTVARFGGDEFTVILSELKDLSDIGRVAQNIIDRLSEPYMLKKQQFYISASIGIALYPADAENVIDLIKKADQSMYKAKNDGKKCYRFFTKAMQEESESHLHMASDLRRALGSDQFEVYYQPIIEFSTGNICKAEALLRWKHPEHGFVSPAVFIPIAEDAGIIQEIGDWVFMQVIHQIKHWQSLSDQNLQISINTSPKQFKEGDLTLGRWIERLLEIGLPGSSIAVEITEGLLMNTGSKITDHLLKFRDAGIQVAIDDFGTGYSSLSYLKKFDIDFLKIDRSFIMNLTPDTADFALCEAIVVMAHKLGLKVIAEGIETEQQRDLLKQINCDYGQGYLFSRPVPANEFEKLF